MGLNTFIIVVALSTCLIGVEGVKILDAKIFELYRCNAAGPYPSNMFSGGVSRLSEVLPALVKYKDMWKPGKIVPSLEKAIVGDHGLEYDYYDKETYVFRSFGKGLVYKSMTNVTVIPSNCITFSSDSYGNPYYFARVNEFVGQQLGYVLGTNGKAYITYMGREYDFDNYELLCLDL